MSVPIPSTSNAEKDAELATMLEKLMLASDMVHKLKDEGREEVLSMQERVKKLRVANIDYYLATTQSLIDTLKAGSRSTVPFEAFQNWVTTARNEMTAKVEELTKLRETPVEAFKQASEEFNAALTALMTRAEAYGVEVPWQIRFAAERSKDGKVELKGGRITDKDGNNIWEAKCHVIQDGAEGEGEARYCCLDVSNVTADFKIFEATRQLESIVEQSNSEELMALMRQLNPYSKCLWVVEHDIDVFQHLDVVESKNLGERINKAFEVYQNRPCLGYPLSERTKETPNELILDGFVWKTYKEIGSLSNALGQFFLDSFPPTSTVGISSKNCAEFMITDFACALSGFISVGLHTTYDDEDLIEVINNSEISVLVCGDLMKEQIIRVFPECPNIECIISMHTPFTSAQSTTIGAEGVRTYSLSDIFHYVTAFEEISGKLEVVERDDDSIFSLLYTSGSTGKPKGVMYTHRIFREDTGHAMYVTPLVNASYIPLSHSTDRMRIWETLQNGGRVGFCNYQHSNWSDHETIKKETLVDTEVSTNGVEELLSDISLLRPTVFVAPPRIWNGIYTIYRSILESNWDSLGEEKSKEIAASKTRKLIGDRAAHLATGGSPSSAEVISWIKSLWSESNFCESYGCTECGGITMNGKLMEDVQVALIDRPEIGYTTADKPFPRGELKVMSPTVAPGYYKNPQETDKAFVDGWYLTGDLCMIDDEGTISVLDRVASVVALPDGNVYLPNHLEAIYQEISFIKHICVYNPANKQELVAIISVNSRLEALTKSASVTSDSVVSLDDPAVVEAVLRELRSHAAAKKLQEHEIPAQVILTRDEWSPQNHMLTVSFKVVRAKVIAQYDYENVQ